MASAGHIGATAKPGEWGWCFDLPLAQADLLALGVAVVMGRFTLPIARAAAAFSKDRGWHAEGFAHAHDFAREQLGRSGEWLRGMARLGKAAGEWPRLAQALLGDDGAPALSAVAAQLVCRVATADTLESWLTLARQLTVRELKDQVTAARQAGSTSPLQGSPAPEPAEDWDDDPDADRDTRTRLDFSLPAAGCQAFRDAFDLHQTLAGYRASVVSFVEALVAEYSGRHGWVDGDFLSPNQAAALRHGTRAARERRCPPSLRFDPPAADVEHEVFAPARARLAAARRLLGQSFWESAHQAALDLKELLRLEGDLQRLLGRLLAVLGRWRGWNQLGFLDLGQYAEERLGISRSSAQELVQAARFGFRHPQVAGRYEAGAISSRQVVLLARELGPEADAAALGQWLDALPDLTVKRLEDGLRWRRRERSLGRLQQDSPPDAPTWRQSIDRRRQAFRRRLGECAQALNTNPEVSEKLRLVLPPELALRLLGALCVAQAKAEGSTPEQVRDRVILFEDFGPRRSIPTFLVDGLGQKGWLGLLQEYVDEWQPAQGRPDAHPLVQRDGYRCTVPGCTARRGLERHHLHFLSANGDREAPENQTTLCWHHHHHGIHKRTMRMWGLAPLDLRCRVGADPFFRYYINECRSARPLRPGPGRPAPPRPS